MTINVIDMPVAVSADGWPHRREYADDQLYDDDAVFDDAAPAQEFFVWLFGPMMLRPADAVTVVNLP